MRSSTSRSIWKSPQTWVIIVLLAVIAAFSFSHFNKPKTNRLQQAAAYFDALEAAERAEAEAEKEKARLAEIAVANAIADAKLAKEKLQQEKATRLAREALNHMKQVDNKNKREPSRYQYANQEMCSMTNDVLVCTVTCRDQYGSQIREIMTAGYAKSTYGAGQWSSIDIGGFYGSSVGVFQAMCSSK